MVSRALVAVIALALFPCAARAQESKSPGLAKELAQILEQKKLDAIAVADGKNPGAYFAALYFPGTQLIVVSAKYASPALLTELLARKDYKGVYAELASASIAGSKVFVMDTYADGLMVKPSGSNAPDSVERAGTNVTFDGEWKKAKLSEADYMKIFGEVESAYSNALQGLIAHLKSSGT